MEGIELDGIGLAALGLGSVLIYAGVKGYSFLAVLENMVTGKPIHTNVKMTQTLTTDTPAFGTAEPGQPVPEGATDSHG
jgi:hypothetical protein